MINKKKLRFLTVFSLVLVLSIYYVTTPNDLLEATTGNINSIKNDEDISVSVNESDTIAALKVEDDSKTTDTLSELQEQLSSAETSTEQKNSLYEQIKTINTNSGLEETLEKKIQNDYQCKAFTKIEDTSVKVVVDKCENSKSLANNIMRLVQEQFDNKMYISVQFES